MKSLYKVLLMSFVSLILVGFVAKPACSFLKFWDKEEAETNGELKERKDTRDPKNSTIAVIETDKGIIKAVLYTKHAPITTKNFIELAHRGFYNQGIIFHRVEEGELIQTGDPTGTGMGGSEKTIPLEVSQKLIHDDAGILSMARKAGRPHSATSQFYITLTKNNKFDGHYAVFGKVFSGMPVLSKIRKGDKLLKVTIEETFKKK